jgi:DedD protein
MEEKNELNDIILNRSSGNNGMKKIMLAVASLAILLIIVVVIMSSLNSEGTANLPQPIEPPKASTATIEEDPLFQPVAIDEVQNEQESLADVAAKIKQQSEEPEFITGPNEVFEEEVTEVVVPAKYEKPVAKKATKPAHKKVTKKKVTKPVAKKSTSKNSIAKTGNIYIQVGSFGRFSPDKKFLKKITDNGYTYKIHKVNAGDAMMTKVLVGPYSSDSAARKDLPSVRAKIVTGAFLSRI